MLCLGLANTVAFALVGMVGGWAYWRGWGDLSQLQELYDRYGVLPLAWHDGWWEGRLGLLTAMFVHVGLWHWLSNLCWLYAFGRQCGAATLPVYLIGGISAGLAYRAAYPDSGVALVGASGAVAGLAGYAVIYHRGRLPLVMRWPWQVAGRTLLGIWCGLQLVPLAVWAAGYSASAGALVPHAGGFLAGALLGGMVRGQPWCWQLVGVIKSRWRCWRGCPDASRRCRRWRWEW